MLGEYAAFAFRNNVHEILDLDYFSPVSVEALP